MVAASSRPDPSPSDGLRASLNGATSAIADYSAASGRCVAAAGDCAAAADKFVAAANAYTAAFAELEIAIVQFKAAVRCAADAPAIHAKALCGIAVDFHGATRNAHKAIVKASTAVDETMAAYNAKNKTLLAEASAFGSKGDDARDKMVSFDAKLKESGLGLTEREVAAFRTEAVAAMYDGDGKARMAIAEQFAASKALELAEKKCDEIAAARDAVQADIEAVVGRMTSVFKKHAGMGR